jgi:hypothetical protein
MNWLREFFREAWRLASISALRFDIDSAEQWIAACERDGITSTDTMRYQRRVVQALRVRLALLENRAAPMCTSNGGRSINTRSM